MSAVKKLLISSVLGALFIILFAGFAYAEENKTATTLYSNVNLRETPDTAAKVLTQLGKGIKVSILQSSDNWYKISADGNTGWVRGDLISVKSGSLGTGYVTENNLNIRTNPSTSSDSLGKLKQGEKVTLLDSSDNWYKLKTSNGTIGWACGDYITTRQPSISRGDDSTPARDERGDAAEAEAADPNTDTVDKLIAYAKKFLGTGYTYGSESPKRGFDCSGFTQYVFDHFGITLERTAYDQSTQGVKVTRATLKPGDLLFFDTNGGHNRVNHVGIYIGDGKFIHASSGKDKVVISDLTEGFYDNAYMKARRYIAKE